MRRWLSFSTVGCAVLLALSTAACSGGGGDGDGSAAGDSADAAGELDAGAVDTVGGDGGDGDGAGDAGGSADGAADDDGAGDDGGPDPNEGAPGPFEAPTAVAVPAPSKVTIDDWVYTLGVSGDPVGDALDKGGFSTPAAGASAHGSTWSATELDESGQLGPFGSGGSLVYAAAKVTRPAAGWMLARVDRPWSIWVNGREMPGDPYGSGLHRVPVYLKAGENWLALRGRGGQKWRVELLELPATDDVPDADFPVWLSPSDVTWPHMLVDWPRTEPGQSEAGDLAERWLGVHVSALTDTSAEHVRAYVVEDENWHGTEVVHEALAAGATTQLAFKLIPKKVHDEVPNEETGEPEVNTPVEVTVRLASPDWDRSYEATLTNVRTRRTGQPFRKTFRSPVDGSVQHYGVRAPEAYDPAKTDYALVLSLHGAGVEAQGQAGSYGDKLWTFIIAPTNRRRFGFDWEEWGRLNAIASLDDAMATYGTEPTRTYLTGHSMGGHGTWQVGVHHAGRFAVMGPSAGWNSFYTYGGSPEPTGPFARSRRHSKTSDFLENLSNRAVYVIHGTADNNVPFSEGIAMFQAASDWTDDIDNHWEEGAGHWWNGPLGEGADCVDWPPLFELMQGRSVDLAETDFSVRFSAPWYGAHYSYVQVLASLDPYSDITAKSALDGTGVTLDVTNARTLRIDPAGLLAKGVQTLTVNNPWAGQQVLDLSDTTLQGPDGRIVLGPTDGKREGVHGPYNQVYQRPFAFIYDDGDSKSRDIAAWMISTWAIIGNGHAIALPASRLTPWLRARRNLIHIGRKPAVVEEEAGIDSPLIGPEGFVWHDAGVQVAGNDYSGAALLMVFDAGDRISGVLHAPKGQEHLLYSVSPFSSRSGMPDFLVFGEGGAFGAGFFGFQWNFDPALVFGLGQ